MDILTHYMHKMAAPSGLQCGYRKGDLHKYEKRLMHKFVIVMVTNITVRRIACTITVVSV